jgi:hypothetical protein
MIKTFAQKIFEVLVGYSFVNIVLSSFLAMIFAIIGVQKAQMHFIRCLNQSNA